MTLGMSDSKELLRKIRDVLDKKTYRTLKADGKNGSKIREVKDEMYGDQLFGHPVLKEFKNKGKY